MSLNSDKIVQDMRQEFESMLQKVQESEEKTADEMERSLFKQLLGLGARLLLLFFIVRARDYTRPEWTTKEDVTLPYHGENERGYYSIFGKLPLSRPYYYKKGEHFINRVEYLGRQMAVNFFYCGARVGAERLKRQKSGRCGPKCADCGQAGS